MALVLSTGVAQAANKEDVMAADPEALARLRATNPQMKAISDEALAQAEIGWAGYKIIARENGFLEWSNLTRHAAEGKGLSPEGTLARLVQAVDAAEPAAVREILSDYGYLARARVWIDEDVSTLGNTLLHRVYPDWRRDDEATDDHLEMARLLIEHGADVNATGGAGNTAGETPLGAVAWAGSLRLWFLLPSSGGPNSLPLFAICPSLRTRPFLVIF